ncbi:acyl carrier protein [Micromonospora yasonensis]|jgi:acyl carrier protein|uniref:acyl carrier protein n=1 Tax=Micromonospora yasonensis TaxID=1128667 RepID=UPI00222E7D0E|nr:acyl carrier protein [Micromonospora yasonensis]MCW3841315.1 acyl carrier protein [Micromonospora yasonensis]
MSLTDRLRGVFVDALELPEGTDVENLTYRGIEQWDSLGHMTLVAAIEDEFDVQLETDQVIDMSSFKVALEMLRGLGVDG